MWSWAACSDPAGAPALPAVTAVFSFGLRICEGMAVISMCLEELSRSNPSPGSRWRRRDRRKTCQMDVEAVRYVLPLQRSRFFASKRGGMAKCSSSY